MKARTPWRKKRNGKFYGNWLVTVDGVDVNLGTKSATIAHQLVPEAERGRRNFQSDAAAAAATLDQVDAGAGVEGTDGGTENRPRAGAQNAQIPPSVPPAPAPAPAPAALPAQAPAALPAQAGQAPSSEENARAEADATNAAAAETSTAAAPPDANNGAGAAIQMDPAAIRGLLAVGAEAMVELQLGLQAWVIKRKTGKEPGLVPADSPMRKIAADCWSAQFTRWFPDLDDVPPWVLGLVVVGACAPYQLATATPIPKKEGADLGAEAPPAAPDPAAAAAA